MLNELVKYDHEIMTTARNVNSISEKYQEKVKLIPFNLEDFNEQMNYFEYFLKPDIIINLAWQGLPNYTSLFHFEKNLSQHYSSIKNIIENGLQKLVVTGTFLEYGMKEDFLSEDMVPNPQNPYALAKECLRKSISELQKLISFDFYMDKIILHVWPRPKC